MDTKLKNYKYSVWLKLLAFLLCIAGTLSIAYGFLNVSYFEDAIQNTDFKESITGKSTFRQAYSNIASLAFIYKNEENIKSGGAIDQSVIESRTLDLNNERASKIQEVEENYNQLMIQAVAGEEDTQSSGGNAPKESSDVGNRLDTLKKQKEAETKEINDKYDQLLKNVKTDYINEQLSNYHSIDEALKQREDIFYTVVENGKATLTNIPEGSSADTFYNELSYSVQLNENNFQTFFSPYGYSISDVPPANTAVYLGMPQQIYDRELTVFNSNSQKGLFGIKISSAGLLALLAGFIYLIYASGRRPDKDGVHLIAIDVIYIDIALAVTIVAVVLCLAPFFEFGSSIQREDLQHYNISIIYSFFGVIIAAATSITLLFVTMFVKRLKRHEAIKYTLIYKVFIWIIGKIKSIYNHTFRKLHSVFDRSPAAVRLVLIFGAYALITFISFLLFLTGSSGVMMGFAGIVGVNIFAIYYLLKTFKTFTQIKDGAEKIRSGELSHNIPEQGIIEFRQLSATINKIADGLKNAVGSQVKAERMKAELITNVSHDLKTPLTSIITYVDLLKTEGLNSENADKYLGIIDSKSQRLKSLTEDLFEAAKATSGNITVNSERLNVASLISQGLGELSDKIEESGLTFKTSMPAENLYVTADGKLLWRVVENLLSNVFKYALPNSRVYINVENYEEKVDIVIKNISAYELNIKEEELMERFKRGDASRHSEGSGLGLSIAKSLTELQGGIFSIKIDGDLFKATVSLPRQVN